MSQVNKSPRRQLLIGAVGVASAAAASQIAQAQTSTPTPSPDGIVIGPTSILEKQGKVLTDKILIVKNTADNQLIGVSPFCTHRNCVVDWKQEQQTFVCPCHGSEFGKDGKVVKGPAKNNLTVYQVEVQGERFQAKPIV